MAERAALDIQIDAAERRARRQRHDIDRRGSGEMKFAKRGLEHAALGAARNEAGGLLRRDAARRGIEHGAQLVRIVGLDDPHQASAEAERRNDGVGCFDRAAKRGDIVAWSCARQRSRRRCRHRQTTAASISGPSCVTSLTRSGSTLAGNPAPNRASASMISSPCSPS